MPHEAEPDFITPDHFAAFGRIVQAFVSVETLYAHTIARILQLDGARAAIVLAQYSYDSLKNLLKTCISETGLREIEIKRGTKLMDKIHDKSALRNNVAHSPWKPGKRVGSIKPLVMRTKGSLFVLGVDHNEKDWTADELNAEADEILERAIAFGEFLVENGLSLGPQDGAD